MDDDEILLKMAEAIDQKIKELDTMSESDLLKMRNDLLSDLGNLEPLEFCRTMLGFFGGMVYTIKLASATSDFHIGLAAYKSMSKFQKSWL